MIAGISRNADFAKRSAYASPVAGDSRTASFEVALSVAMHGTSEP